MSSTTYSKACLVSMSAAPIIYSFYWMDGNGPDKIDDRVEVVQTTPERSVPTLMDRSAARNFWAHLTSAGYRRQIV